MNNLLKYFYYASLCCLLISCKKTGSNIITITVVEYGTNKPIPQAQVDLYKAEDCYWLSCTYVKVGVVKVDDNGKCAIPQNTSKIGVRANGYFEVRYNYFQDQVIPLDVIGQIKIHCIMTNNYPTRSIFGVNIQGENTASGYLTREYVYKNNYDDFWFPVNNDSTIVTKAFGGQVNSITWIVQDSTGTMLKNGGPLQIAVPRTGVAELEIKY